MKKILLPIVMTGILLVTYSCTKKKQLEKTAKVPFPEKDGIYEKKPDDWMQSFAKERGITTTAQIKAIGFYTSEQIQLFSDDTHLNTQIKDRVVVIRDTTFITLPDIPRLTMGEVEYVSPSLDQYLVKFIVKEIEIKIWFYLKENRFYINTNSTGVTPLGQGWKVSPASANCWLMFFKDQTHVKNISH